MKNPRILFLILILMVTGCSPAATLLPPTATPEMLQPTETILVPTASPTATETLAPTPTATSTPLLTDTPTLTPIPTSTETLGEKLKTHIVFYLIIPDGERRDACGNIKVEPIISKRMRTGDKLQDVQIALNMLFSVGTKYYGAYYNALWDTQFTIEATEYNAVKDYMTITFGGYFPYTALSACDKHGIREQIWTTFFHYDFKEKTFKYYNRYLIDRLGGS
jgi:hypothetical protein